MSGASSGGHRRRSRTSFAAAQQLDNMPGSGGPMMADIIPPNQPPSHLLDFRRPSLDPSTTGPLIFIQLINHLIKKVIFLEGWNMAPLH